MYSHGHTAYNHGVVAWLADSERRGDPAPTIIAHRNVLHRLQRYRETQEYLERVTEWQFGFANNSIVGTHMFEILVDPDVTYIDEMTLPTPRAIQLIHCHAETDDGHCAVVPRRGDPLRRQRHHRQLPPTSAPPCARPATRARGPISSTSTSSSMPRCSSGSTAPRSAAPTR